MKTLTMEDIDDLRRRLAEKGPLWQEWQYKLHGGNIIILHPCNTMEFKNEQTGPREAIPG